MNVFFVIAPNGKKIAAAASKKEKFDFVRIVIEKKEANGNFEITNAFEVDIDTYEKDIEGSNLEKYIKTLPRRKLH